ncbi:hypothetical protein LBMAG56_10560 [Verrucomicrobiota bacterium]|nr:hypothetical protein LBMAG56_10560 [Verrucomicrobiota bacterium]
MNRDAPVCLTAYSTSRLQIPNHRRFKTLSALTLNLRAFRRRQGAWQARIKMNSVSNEQESASKETIRQLRFRLPAP